VTLASPDPACGLHTRTHNQASPCPVPTDADQLGTCHLSAAATLQALNSGAGPAVSICSSRRRLQDQEECMCTMCCTVLHPRAGGVASSNTPWGARRQQPHNTIRWVPPIHHMLPAAHTTATPPPVVYGTHLSFTTNTRICPADTLTPSRPAAATMCTRRAQPLTSSTALSTKPSYFDTMQV
jgi:hypothetical protein